MKERISEEQLQELSPEQQEKLREWWEPKEYDVFIAQPYGTECILIWRLVDQSAFKKLWNELLPLLSIGQMIGMLSHYHPHFSYRCMDEYNVGHEKLCDEMWEDMKYALKKALEPPKEPRPPRKEPLINMQQAEEVFKKAYISAMVKELNKPSPLYDQISKEPAHPGYFNIIIK